MNKDDIQEKTIKRLLSLISKYKILTSYVKSLEMYHQKGGDYIIPVEDMNYIFGEIEDLEEGGEDNE